MTSNENDFLMAQKNILLNTIGMNIQIQREKKGYSQVDLASRMIGKFDTTNISRIESGRVNPTIFTLFRITQALEIHLSDILPSSLAE